MLTIPVPDNYGNVLAIALGAIPLLAGIHGHITGSLRREAKVPYPNCYATIEQCKANPKCSQFNCAQRAHANYLENMTQTMAFVLVAGLKYPNAATAVGAAWVFFRSLYLYGYIYGDQPNGRGRFYGSPFWACQAALWGMSVLGVGLPMIKLGVFGK